jgi:two-component system CheB/CheR fusion protein
MGVLLEADARCACRRTLLTLSTDNSVYPAAALFTIVPSTDVWRALVVQDWEPNIYVVDDDEAVRDSLRVLLEAHGMVVEDYGSSEAFARGYVPGRKGCLILDLHLPGASGLDYLATQDDAAAELPVIVVTGRSDSASRARAEQLGVLAFLDKPVAGEILLANIRQAFGQA